MKFKIACLLQLVVVVGITQNPIGTVEQDFELILGGEFRYFLESGQFAEQAQSFPALSITPSYALHFNRNQTISAKGFFRLDRDDNRTHFDIRELYYQRAHNKWEFNIGLQKVFWGVTESNHLVDIVNQTDQVESFDGEQKLGQPLLAASYTSGSWGSFTFYYLPVHRKRVFSGADGRFRFRDIIDVDDIDYTTTAAEWQPSFALRWSHYLGAVDIGISQFYGVGREPLFEILSTGDFFAFYPEIYQAGLEVQVTQGAFLWKLESIYRYADIQDFFAVTAGFEYTFSNLNGKGFDVGLLSEYIYDSRDEWTLSGLNNDLFAGVRLAWNDINDSSILVGGFRDLELNSTILSVEGSRRFGNSQVITIEARLFPDIDEQELFLANFSSDSFLRIALDKYF